MTEDQRLRQQEGMTTDSDSTTTNLLDETLTFAHASKRVDEIADLQSRLQQVEQERDQLKSMAPYVESSGHYCDGITDAFTYAQAAEQRAVHWKELATEAHKTILSLCRYHALGRTHPSNERGEVCELTPVEKAWLARYDALQQEEDAR